MKHKLYAHPIHIVKQKFYFELTFCTLEVYFLLLSLFYNIIQVWCNLWEINSFLVYLKTNKTITISVPFLQQLSSTCALEQSPLQAKPSPL